MAAPSAKRKPRTEAQPRGRARGPPKAAPGASAPHLEPARPRAHLKRARQERPARSFASDQSKSGGSGATWGDGAHLVPSHRHFPAQEKWDNPAPKSNYHRRGGGGDFDDRDAEREDPPEDAPWDEDERESVSEHSAKKRRIDFVHDSDRLKDSKLIIVKGLNPRAKTQATIQKLKTRLKGVAFVVYPAPEGTEKSPAARILFETLEDRDAAIEALHRQRDPKLGGVVRAFVVPSSERVSRLIIHNVSFACDEERLRSTFATYGPLVEAPHDVRLCKGFAFVEFERLQDADKAVRRLNNSRLMGRPITVSWALSKKRHDAKSTEDGEEDGAGAAAAAGEAPTDADVDSGTEADTEDESRLGSSSPVIGMGLGDAEEDDDDEAANDSGVEMATLSSDDEFGFDRDDSDDAELAAAAKPGSSKGKGGNDEIAKLAARAAAAGVAKGKGLPQDAVSSDEDSDAAAADDADTAEKPDDDSDAIFDRSSSEEDDDDDAADADADAKKTRRYDVDAGLTLFVEKIPADLGEEDIREGFEKFGEVEYVKLCAPRPGDDMSARVQLLEGGEGAAHRGCGFVKFKERQSVLMAFGDKEKGTAASNVTRSDSAVVDLESGDAVQALLAVRRDRVHKLQTKRKKQKGDKRNLYLAKLGAVTSPDDPLAKTLTPEDLEYRTQAWKEKKMALKANVNLHVSKRRLAVKNLPPDTTKGDLKRIFLAAAWKARKEKLASRGETIKSAGAGVKPTVIQSKVIYDMDRAAKRSKRYGFIEFDDHYDALAALKAINATNALGDQSMVFVEFAVDNILRMRAQKRASGPMIAGGRARTFSAGGAAKPARGAAPKAAAGDVSKDFEGAKGSKSFKGAKDSKSFKGSKDAKSFKGSKDSKSYNRSKDSKSAKGSKDSKSAKGSKDAKSAKSFKGSKDSKAPRSTSKSATAGKKISSSKPSKSTTSLAALGSAKPHRGPGPARSTRPYKGAKNKRTAPRARGSGSKGARPAKRRKVGGD